MRGVCGSGESECEECGSGGSECEECVGVVGVSARSVGVVGVSARSVWAGAWARTQTARTYVHAHAKKAVAHTFISRAHIPATK